MSKEEVTEAIKECLCGKQSENMEETHCYDESKKQLKRVVSLHPNLKETKEVEENPKQLEKVVDIHSDLEKTEDIENIHKQLKAVVSINSAFMKKDDAENISEQLEEFTSMESDLEQRSGYTEKLEQDYHLEKKNIRELSVEADVQQRQINYHTQENADAQTLQVSQKTGQEAMQYANNMYLAKPMGPTSYTPIFDINDNGANFTARVISRKRNIRSKDGTDDQLLMKLCFDGINEVNFSCGLEEVESIHKKIPAIYPQALILNRKTFIASIRMQCSNMPTYFFVDETGMYYSPQNRFEFYVGGKMYPSVINEVQEHFVFNGASDIKQALELCIDLTYDKKKSIFILLYGFMATIKLFFESAKIPLRFGFMIFGESGSMKTSVAQVLFKMFDTQKIAGFTDTDAALEKQLAMSKSRVLLVDDFHPGDSKEGQTKSLAKLEKLLRYVSDNKTRAKSNLRGGIDKDEMVEGLLVITAEFVPVNCASSLARYFRLQLTKGDVDTDVLTKLQQNSGVVQLVYAKFVEFAVEKQEGIIELISRRGNVIRRNNRSKFKHARTLDQYVAFSCMIEIFAKFCDEYKVRIDQQDLYVNLKEYISATEDVSEAVRMSINAAKCIAHFLEKKKLIANNMEEYVGSANKIGVLENESDIALFDEEKLLFAIKIELQQKRKEAMTDQQILEELQMLKVVEYRPNGKKKTRRIRKSYQKKSYPFVGINYKKLMSRITEIEEKRGIYL